MKIRQITIRLPEKLIQEMDKLVKEGRFKSRSQIIQFALADFIYKVNKIKFTPKGKGRKLVQLNILVPMWMKEALREIAEEGYFRDVTAIVRYAILNFFYQQQCKEEEVQFISA